jgi:O-antigen ligase
VNAIARQGFGEMLRRRWHDPAAWMTTADIVAVLLAVSLPWSTSLVGIFGVVIVLVMLPTIDATSFMASLKRPACAAPVALFALALLGTLWSDARWGLRFYAVAPTVKLLLLPLLFYHFERSQRGQWVFIAFLASCVVLLAMSWIVFFFPELTLKAKYFDSPGIFVKNYIDQSQEFALCAVALAFPVLSMLRERRFVPALLLLAIAMGFLANMVFVIVSRTALVTMPIMLGAFGLVHLRWRTSVIIFAAAIALAGLAWTVSPPLQEKVYSISREYQLYQEHSSVTSVGERLEFWRKSLRFFVEAPIAGHGTGSTEGLFQQAAIGQTGTAAEVVRNPHNQTLNVAVQWGTIGVIALYAMWLSHLLLFRGEGEMAWIGLMVVVQNFLTSLFNSHIFDFHEGWMYVMGVGVAGGFVMKASAKAGAHSADAS